MGQEATYAVRRPNVGGVACGGRVALLCVENRFWGEGSHAR